MNRKEDIIEYISIYCTQFYNEKEKAAINHHFAQVKLLTFKDKMEKIRKHYDEMTSNDPTVLELLKDGINEFHKNAATRVYMEHLNELTLNRCPKCDGIARTPTAKQCRYCGNDWH